jgi:hypothetical protein
MREWENRRVADVGGMIRDFPFSICHLPFSLHCYSREFPPTTDLTNESVQ